MSWRNYQTGLPLIMPLYYSDPNENTFTFTAYSTYWFGSELLAAPFTKPASEETGISRQIVWLQQGDWFDFFSGERLVGAGWRAVYGLLDDIPVFAKAGAIVPLGPQVGWGGFGNPDQLTLLIFPGADNTFDLYEDDGETTAYTRGEQAITTISQTWKGDSLVLTLAPVRGEVELVPAKRQYRLCFRGIAAPAAVSITCNDSSLSVEQVYRPESETLEIGPIELEPCDELVVTLSGELLATRDRSDEKLQKYLTHFKIDTWEKAAILKEWPRLASGEYSLQRYRHLSDAQIQVLESLLKDE
jgi:hypothetical protein